MKRMKRVWRLRFLLFFFNYYFIYFWVFFIMANWACRAGVSKLFASKIVCHVFYFLSFFKRIFIIIIHQFYLCSKAQARLGYNKGHFIKVLTVHLGKWLMPPLHVMQILLKCAVSFGLSPVWVQLEDLPVNFKKFSAGISSQRICIQSL
jgi:hypothetical protein